MHSLESTVSPLIVAAAAFYALAWLTLVGRRNKVGYPFLALAWGLNGALFIVNGLIVGEPPFGNMYHVQVFLSLCFVPLLLILAFRYKLSWAAPYFACAAILPLIGAFFMDHDASWRRVPALQSPWFVPHVFAYMVSYALAAIAFALTMARFARTHWRPTAPPLPYQSASCEVLRLAFPFMTFGMLSGALWAEEAWGAYWSWDPKETWSLITWTLYLAYFHCRGSKTLSKYAEIPQVLAFCALLTTFFLVNLLPKLSSVLHSYA